MRLRLADLPAHREFIRHEWHSGTPAQEIAGSLDVAVPDVLYFALWHGWPPRTGGGQPRCLGPREIDKIRTRWHKGTGVQEIAAEFSCDELSIRILARCHSWPPRNIPLHQLYVRDELTIRELWHAGWPIQQIAQLFGLMPKDIQQLVVVRGWPFRTCQMPRIRLDPQQEADMRALWEGGVPVDQIAQRFGVGEMTVRHFATQGRWSRVKPPRQARARRVLPPRRRSVVEKLDPARRAGIRAMWDDRCPVAEIARRFGLGKATVYRLARAGGFPRRRVGRPGMQVDPETQARLEELWQSDLSLAELGRRCDLPECVIRRLARENDWPARLPRDLGVQPEPLPEAQIAELWHAGLPIRDIAHHCNAPFTQVHLLLRKWGWAGPRRRRHRVPSDKVGPRGREMIELFLSNEVNTREVGETFGVSRSYVAWLAQPYREVRG